MVTVIHIMAMEEDTMITITLIMDMVTLLTTVVGIMARDTVTVAGIILLTGMTM
jgi:hypothetical protein